MFRKLLIIFALVAFAPLRGEAAIAYVSGGHVEAATTSSATLSTAATAHGSGHLVLVYLAWDNFNSATISSVRNSASESFTCNFTIGTTGGYVDFCWRANATGNAADVITVTMSAAPTALQMGVDEFSGVATSSVDDNPGSDFNTGTITVTTNAFTTSQADCVIVAFGEWLAGTAAGGSASAGYTLTVDGAGNASNMLAAYRIVSAIQTSVTITLTGGANVNSAIYEIPFKAAAGGGGGATVHHLGTLGVGP